MNGDKIMTIKQLSCQTAALLSCAVIGAEEPRFPEFGTLPPELLFPRHAKLTADAHGNLLVNGKKRFLIGTEIGIQQLAGDLEPSIGYADRYKWLYEEPLTYENAQRLGLDTISVFTPDWWIRKIEPAFKPQLFHNRKNRAMIRQVLGNGLPIIADYTCFPWRHGGLVRPELRHLLPEEAFNKYNTGNGNHWVPYNIFHPEARKIYRRYWQDGAEFMKQNGANVLAYELFNEPAYNDPSPYNRVLFARFLKAKYNTPEAMNRTWRTRYVSFEEAANVPEFIRTPGLAVDWGKFLEKGFTELAKYGCEAIREIDPHARITFQTLGFNNYRSLPATNINIWEINRFMDVISTSTVGGIYVESAFSEPPPVSVEAPSNPTSIGEGILERHFYRNCAADGKIIVNPEAYVSRNPAALRGKIWLDLLRGGSIDNFFTWQKRAWDYKFDGKRAHEIAEKFPYMLLIPQAIPTGLLTEFLKAKREIQEYGEFFIPKELRPKAEIALLISFPTERYGAATGNTAKNEILHYAAALEFAHYPADVLVEEQLRNGVPEQYRAVIAVGVDNTLPGTAAALEKFARNGGLVIGARRKMELDEYGNRIPDLLFSGLKLQPLRQTQIAELEFSLPREQLFRGKLSCRTDSVLQAQNDWSVVGSTGTQPQIVQRGTVCFIAPFFQEYALAGILGTILNSAGIQPDLKLFRVPAGDMAINIEAHSARKDGLHLVFLHNFDSYPKLTEIELEKERSAITLPGRNLLPVQNGRARFLLPSNGNLILAMGKRAALEQRFGTIVPETRESLQKQFDALERIRKTERELARNSEMFTPEPSATFPLDLRRFCNSSFTDSKPGDGEGGWTDQGSDNSLDGVPWGLQTFKGVPCEIIRPDSNDDRSCIILNSVSSKRALPQKTEGIPVNEKVRALYFFHTCAFGKTGQKIMTYRIRYADGGTLELPVRNGTEIEDWWTMLTRARKMARNIAWKNTQGRGFYLWRWENPEPDRTIAAVDILSENAAPIPIVIGITCEKFTGSKKIIPLDGIQGKAFGKCRLEQQNGTLRIHVSAETGNWAGISLTAPGIIWNKLPPETVIRFKINGGLDPFGNRRGGQTVQLKLGKRFKFPSVDADPETFEEFSVPVRELYDPAKNSNALLLQFTGTGRDAGVELREFRLEYPPEP